MDKRPDRLSEKVGAAFQAVATAVMERARQTGTPVIVWEDGQIKEISSEEFEQRVQRPDQSQHPDFGPAVHSLS